VGSRSDRDFTTFPAEPVALEPYTVLDLSGEVRLGSAAGGSPPVTLTATLENAFDEGYEEVLGFVTPGRALYVGASVTLGRR